jgi:hypothetical protein
MVKVPGHPEGGADPMIVTIPPRVESFCERFQGELSESKRQALGAMLSGYLLTSGKRTQSAVGREVLDGERAPSSVSRRMRRESFRTRDLVRAEMKRQIGAELTRAGKGRETWFLGLDGVASQRGNRTKVENALKYRKKQRGCKGRSTKTHLFVQGLLITASGVRIPLPRRSYYTQAYVRRQNRMLKLGPREGQSPVYKTQVDLACLIVKELKLPGNIRLVVLGDEYFEGTKLTGLCRKKGYAFIAPVNSHRNFESGGKLYTRGKALPRSAYRELVLRRGEEDTASHRRHLPEGAGEKDRRVYRFHCERRTVARTGEVAVVYSWKRRRDRSGRLTSRETFKTLVCSDPRLLGEEDIEKIGAMIIEFFEMRWAIEVFFRELKSDLGFSDYQGTNFRAFERHIDLVLLSFMLLEQMRREELARTRSPVRRRELAAKRTSGMKARLAREAHLADVSWFAKHFGKRNRPRHLSPLLSSPQNVPA